MTDAHLELVLKFFESKHGINQTHLDLIKAINCYRLYDNLDQLLALNPELLEVKADLVELWNEFDNLTDSELSGVVLELMRVQEE